MIETRDDIFHLCTANTSLLFRSTDLAGHPELIHYGARVSREDAAALAVKRAVPYGCAVNYSADDPIYSLDAIPLLFSGAGRGDYRESPVELESAVGRATDFTYKSHEVRSGIAPLEGMPQARGGDETLVLTLEDKAAGAELTLYFTVFEAADVITRRAVLTNTGDTPIAVRKLMSQMLDLPGTFVMTTFNGAHIAEARRLDTPVGEARVVNEAVTGFSSNRHNPGFLLSEPGAGEDHGRVYGFNLVWSGNHYASAQRQKTAIVSCLQRIAQVVPAEHHYLFELIIHGVRGGQESHRERQNYRE